MMYPSHFCRVRVTSPSSQSNLKISCVVRISVNVSWFRVYSDKKSEKVFFFISRNWSQHHCWNIETLCKFCYFGTIFAISETKVSYLFPLWNTACIVRHFTYCSTKTNDQTHHRRSNSWIFVSLILWHEVIALSKRHFNVKKETNTLTWEFPRQMPHVVGIDRDFEIVAKSCWPKRNLVSYGKQIKTSCYSGRN